MEMTAERRQQLHDNGFIALPGIIPQERVEKALRAINASLGSNGIDPGKLVQFRAQSYCPELQRSPDIVGLLNETPLLAAVESLVGEGQLRPVTGGQIALRFPSMDAPREPHPHLDGMPTPTNGVAPGQISSFTALVGVFLSDLPQPFMGNFTVWPGSHHLYEAYFREHTPQSLLDGMPEVELPQPQQFTGKAGDAVICHYQLGHGIAGNASAFIRYAVFFRLTHIAHDQHKWEAMTDIWREWQGLRAED